LARAKPFISGRLCLSQDIGPKQGNAEAHEHHQAQHRQAAVRQCEHAFANILQKDAGGRSHFGWGGKVWIEWHEVQV